MRRRMFIASIIAVSSASLYLLSNGWERAFAELKLSELSPDGCIRIDTYTPFWVLPSLLHRIPNPDTEADPYPLGMRWDYPIFRRAYEASTNTFLGETVVYDATASFDSMYWNQSRVSGRRVVYSHGFPLLDSDRCADAATLSKLSAFYKEQQEEHAIMMKQWDEQGNHSDEDDR